MNPIRITHELDRCKETDDGDLFLEIHVMHFHLRPDLLNQLRDVTENFSSYSVDLFASRYVHRSSACL